MRLQRRDLSTIVESHHQSQSSDYSVARSKRLSKPFEFTQTFYQTGSKKYAMKWVTGKLLLMGLHSI